MRRGSGNLWFGLIALAIVLGLAALAWALSAQNASLLEAFGWITGAFLPAIMYISSELQKRSLRVFLFTNQIRSMFSGRALTWNLSVTLEGQDITGSVFTDVINKLASLANNRVNVRIKKVNDYNSVVDIVPGPTLDLVYNPSITTSLPDEGSKSIPQIQLFVRNYRVGYRQISRAMKREIIPVLESVVEVVKMADSKYTLTIDYDKKDNPFFGLFISNLPLNAVSNFHVRLNLNDLSKDTSVLISDTKIAINTRSQHVLQNLALEFLAFEYSTEEYLKRA